MECGDFDEFDDEVATQSTRERLPEHVVEEVVEVKKKMEEKKSKEKKKVSRPVDTHNSYYEGGNEYVDTTNEFDDEMFEADSPSESSDSSSSSNRKDEKEIELTEDKSEFVFDENQEDDEDNEIVKEFEEPMEKKKLKFDVESKIPLRWEAYNGELLIIIFVIIYLTNYLFGRQNNQEIISHWYNMNKEFLNENFLFVGDDGMPLNTTPPTPLANMTGSGELLKLNECSYALWCSGRENNDGLLISMRLQKRHDLLSYLYSLSLSQKNSDDIILKLNLQSTDVAEPFVFCLTNKRCSSEIQQKYLEINRYCQEKNLSKFDIDNKQYLAFSEIDDIISIIMNDSIFSRLFKESCKFFNYLLISDQHSYSSLTGGGVYSTVVILSFNLNTKKLSSGDFPSNGHALDYLKFLLYLNDKLNKIHLGKEAKNKIKLNRRRIEEESAKHLHYERSENAQQRKDQVKKLNKQKIYDEDDPVKQRKMEEKERKKELKQKQRSKAVFKVLAR
ncbi:hypothetical protein SNEBB_007220 [Seison nebaliae]|nr:hypothetical protein SNEBB_007220 [Seison nebaliae]